MHKYFPNKKYEILIINVSIALILIILLIKYFSVQIINYQKYVNQSRRNSIRQVIKKAPRGIIYDRNNIAIVDNRPIFDLQLIPDDVNSDFDFSLLTSISDIDSILIKDKLKKNKFSINKFKPMTIKRHLSYIEMSKLKENLLKLPGIIFSEIPSRIYPTYCGLSHILGYLREVNAKQLSDKKQSIYRQGDIIGIAGIEKQYETFLRGIDGIQYHMVDKYGRDHGIINEEVKYNKKSGSPVILTIDSRLQYYSEQLLKNHKGALVCMNPKNGDVLALVSSPQFDLNSFIGPIPYKKWEEWNQDSLKPLTNRAISGFYSPGSIFKLVTAAMILESNKVNREKKTTCRGNYKYYGMDRHCWKLDGHGDVNLNEAIKYSCNIYFYKAIQKFKLDDWFVMSEKFGFNKITKIDLPNESNGIIPDKEYMDNKYTSKGWAFGNLLNFVIGQGEVITTPIQIVQLMNIISTKGYTKSPHLILDGKSDDVFVSLKPDTWEFLQQSLNDVVNVNGGTGSNARILNGASVSGKTGTVENPPNEPHSWFAGYMQTDKKELLSLALIIENGGKGSEIATPIAKKIFQEYIRINNIDREYVE